MLLLLIKFAEDWEDLLFGVAVACLFELVEKPLNPDGLFGPQVLAANELWNILSQSDLIVWEPLCQMGHDEFQDHPRHDQQFLDNFQGYQGDLKVTVP